MKKVVQVGFAIAYPFLIYFGLKITSPTHVSLLMLAALLVMLFMADERSSINYIRVGIAALIVALSVLRADETWVLLYPVVVNISMLALFTHSYLNPPNIIQKWATLMEGELSVKAQNYTRKVCLTWMGFFLLNATIAASTVFLFPQYWLAYNGFVSYVLIGCLFAGEYLVRLKVKREDDINVAD